MVASRHVPVIIGTGVTGLAISRALSVDGIDHVLVGRPPTRTPRLGESLDITATLAVLDSFPEFSEYLYPKSQINFLLGEREVSCDLQFGRKWYVKTPMWLSRLETLERTVHVDRVGFDCALFESVIQSPHCRFEDTAVAQVVYEPTTDRIDEVYLSTGEAIVPSHVFDATFFKGPVPMAVGLTHQELSTPQLVGFAHYQRTAGNCCDEQDWEHRTTLSRLMLEPDGVDGFAWCIPVGDTLSVGISTEANDCDCSAEELIDLTEQAYRRRGLEFTAKFGQRTSLTTLRNKYFIQDRLSGANWMLAGTSACQIWYMSGSGVGLGLAAAHIATKFLTNPARYGRLYQHYANGLVKAHEILAELRYTDTTSADVPTLHKLFDRLVHSNVERTARYFQVQENRVGAFLSHLSYQMCVATFALRKYCAITRRGGAPSELTDARSQQVTVSADATT